MLNKIHQSNKDKEKGLKLPKKISPELAYLIGVLSGDGSLGYRPNKHEYSLKCVGNPFDEIEFYERVISLNFKTVFGFSPNMKYFDKKTTFGFRIFSKSLVIFLTDIIGLPLGKKYPSLDIPKLLYKNENLMKYYIRGLFDTDGSISFKKKYKNYPYYPVISFSSKSKNLARSVANFLKNKGFKVVETYDYKLIDQRISIGFTIINRIELNGINNFNHWIELINFSSPKHLNKIKNWRVNSGKRI